MTPSKENPQAQNAAQKTAVLLEQMWRKNRPLLDERLALLQEALEKLSAGPLPEALRTEVISISHKLAGTLGMFGLQTGTDAAREIELTLTSSHPAAATFSTALLNLKEAISSRDKSALKSA
jgi:HPt (histidine-containing phosphotransfer) domain-containing protein